MSSTKSVVISCAGIGSRLGLGLTKALLEINGRSLISWQLDFFREIEDVRIVVGFQAQQIMDEVLKYRSDVTFCYNQKYFETKTGASFYLGARHAGEYVLEWDGDLIVHPDDASKILACEGEFVCYADRSSDDAVFVRTDEKGNVLGFSRENGDYEWTGPACIQRERVVYSSQNVYNIFEPYLPMRGLKVRAYDIDTYDDYIRVSEIIKHW